MKAHAPGGALQLGPAREQRSSPARPGLVYVDVSDVSGEPTLDELAEESVRAIRGGRTRRSTANPPTTGQRRPCLRDPGGVRAGRDGQTIQVNLSLIGGTTKQRRTLVQSVLASWQWS